VDKVVACQTCGLVQAVGDVPEGSVAKCARCRFTITHRRIDSRARTALTLGLLSILLGVLTGIPAIWVGRQALRHIDAADGALRGRWAAWTGIVLGCLSFAATIGLWLYLHEN
jgi:hypothetical protein